MKLYTSYWAQVRNFPKNLVGLNTTVWPPKWRPLGQDKSGIWVIDCPPLKPGAACEGLCRGACSPKHPEDCEFLKVYHKQLQDIDFSNFIRKLEHMKSIIEEGEYLENVNFAFIVFEAPTNLCSERGIIQSWFAENGTQIEEWKK